MTNILLDNFFNKVVFPAPFFPRRQTISLSLTLILYPLTSISNRTLSPSLLLILGSLNPLKPSFLRKFSSNSLLLSISLTSLFSLIKYTLLTIFLISSILCSAIKLFFGSISLTIPIPSSSKFAKGSSNSMYLGFDANIVDIT
ncbi:hypothetical protein BFU36_04975 [Sulfolobus sp. A20]|nr:hypothetical protein BFU36_04975 [Sulfolobus sp. A20]